MKSPVGTLSDRTVLRQQDGGALPRQVQYWAFIDHAPSWGGTKNLYGLQITRTGCTNFFREKMHFLRAGVDKRLNA